MARKRVLVITGDPVGVKMAGPAIRAWNIATELAKHHDVTLVSFTATELVPAPFSLHYIPAGDNRAFKRVAAGSDVIIVQGHAMAVFGELQQTQSALVVDIYDPMHLEQLEQARNLPRGRWESQVRDATRTLNNQLALGDFFICASERQRLFWLGQLAALGRLNPDVYEHDPDLRGLIDVAPFGIPETPPVHVRQVLKGVYPGIAADARVLLWSGGLYNWFDPQSLIRATAQLAKSHPEIVLFFLGVQHPHPGVPEMEIVRRSRELARELNVLDKNVFFNENWVDYGDRQNYLLEADLGVSTHHDHIETTFSFRTRILDYLWAGLPMVVTRGDHFGDLVETENLGRAVDAEDVPGLVTAIETLLFDSENTQAVKQNISRIREDYFWSRALSPLLKFVNAAHYAPDLPPLNRENFARKRYAELAPHDVRQSKSRRVLEIFKGEGPRGVFAAIQRKLRH